MLTSRGIAALLGSLFAASTAHAVVVISITVNVDGSNNGVFARSDPVEITASGKLIAPFDRDGRAIVLEGGVENFGLLQAAFGTLVNGVSLGGTSINHGTIRAATLSVRDGATFTNTLRTLGGLVETGASFLTPNDYVTLIDGSGALGARARAEQGFDVGGRVLNDGTWISFANGFVGGVFENNGVFQDRRNPSIRPISTVGAGFYERRLTIRGAFGQDALINTESGVFETSNGHVMVIDRGARVRNGGTMTIGGELIAEVSTGGVALVNSFSNTGQFTATGGGIVRGRLDSQLVNSGTMTLNGSSQFHLEDRSAFDNEGSLTVTDSAAILVEDSARFLNIGTLEISKNAQARFTGNAEFENAGTVTVRGDGFVNEGITIRNQTGGRFVIFRAAGVGGEEGVLRQSSGLFDNKGLLRVEGSFQGGFVQNGDATGVDSLVFVTAGGVLRADSFWHDGLLVSVASGGTLIVTQYVQTTGTLSVNGEMNTLGGGRIEILGGVLEGTGRINGSVFVGGAGGGVPQTPPGCTEAGFACFRPGRSPGHFEVDGTLTVASGGIVELEVGLNALGELAWDTIRAPRIVFEPGSAIEIVLGAGIGNLSGQPLRFLECTEDCSFGDVQVSVLGGTGTVEFDSAGLLLLDAQPIPEPETWAMLLLGLVGVLVRRRVRVS